MTETYDPAKELQVDTETMSTRFSFDGVPTFRLEFEPVEDLEDWQWELEHKSRARIVCQLIGFINVLSAVAKGVHEEDEDATDEMVERWLELERLFYHTTGYEWQSLSGRGRGYT